MKTYNIEKQICLNDFEKTIKFRKKWEIIGHLLQQSIKTLKLEYILSRCNGWRDGSVCVYLVYVLCAYICVYFIYCTSWFYFFCVNLKKKIKKRVRRTTVCFNFKNYLTLRYFKQTSTYLRLELFLKLISMLQKPTQ